MGVVLVKPGVEFTKIAPGGFRILSALDQVAASMKHDLTITCACEGHPPEDPHSQGKAYDVRSHDIEDDCLKKLILDQIMRKLGPRFYGFLEKPGTPEEHFHIQVAKGTVYP